MFEAIRARTELGVHRTPMQRHVGLGDVTAAWRTYAIIKELQPSVLHGHGAKGGVHARPFGSLLRVSRSRVARLYSPHGGSLHDDENSTAGAARPTSSTTLKARFGADVMAASIDQVFRQIRSD